MARPGGNPPPPPPPPQYGNPFRDVKNLSPERVDMGVDYAGAGPVYALGPGVITSAGHAWQGAIGAPYPGTWITERLTSGPLAGQSVYVAEDIFNIGVQPGQRVTADTVLGQLQGGLETGIAAPGAAGTQGETAAAAAGQAATGGDPGAHPTGYGVAYDTVLKDVGTPGGIISPPVTGEPPSWLKNVGKGLHGTAPPPKGGPPSWVTDIPIIGPIIGGSYDTAHALTAIAVILQRFETMVEWWAAPSHWFRIFAGITGTGFVVYGVVTLARPRVNLPVLGSTPVVPGGELGPALGIASVTTGAVLLFFAFHNTGVGSWNELLGAVRGRLHGQPVQVSS